MGKRPSYKKRPIYCGTSMILPEWYETRGRPYDCLRKGYGICYYMNKEGTGIRANLPSISSTTRKRIYCGTEKELPSDYARKGSAYECLRKGYGVCLYNPRRRKMKMD